MAIIKNILNMNIRIDATSDRDIYEKLDLFVQFLLKNKIEGSINIFVNKKEYEFDDEEE